MTGNSPMFERTRFAGTLSGHGDSHPVAFTAEVNNEGVLAVHLERLPFSDSAYGLFRSPEPTEPLDRTRLDGVAGNGATFSSDSFSILHFSHGSIEGRELEFQGDCALADITRIVDEPRERSSKVWLMRKFSTIHRISHETPIGTAWVGGADESADSQVPRGFLQLIHPSGLADDAWLEESDRFLIHVARILSFACGTYLAPVVERRLLGAQDRLRIVRRPRATRPSFAPFTFLHLEPIFALACDSYPARMDAIAGIDAAIRWLAMPAPTWESELVNAMTAIENLLEEQLSPAARLFQSGSAFKKTVRPLRHLLLDGGAPSGMIDKLPELNRRSFREQLEALLLDWAIVTTDLPEGWLEALIATRNNIIHTGVLPPDLVAANGVPRHVIWAREVAVRLILHILGFVGSYQSWLHNDRTLHFPTCRPVEEVAAT
ncbi:MAG: hypothetical protein JWQ16_2432 [Novosphingobium sp.]|nr:hypothetical protein [Novosphingobium sp.]